MCVCERERVGVGNKSDSGRKKNLFFPVLVCLNMYKEKSRGGESKRSRLSIFQTWTEVYTQTFCTLYQSQPLLGRKEMLVGTVARTHAHLQQCLLAILLSSGRSSTDLLRPSSWSGRTLYVHLVYTLWSRLCVFRWALPFTPVPSKNLSRHIRTRLRISFFFFSPPSLWPKSFKKKEPYEASLFESWVCLPVNNNLREGQNRHRGV